jgi:SAM-dependent methyltransferase
MRRFWDERAREDAMHFVDNRLPYGAKNEDRFWADGAHDLEILLATAGVRPDPRDEVLEIGCGVGRLTRALAPSVATVVALDVSGEMLARAKRLNPTLDNVRWLQGDGSSLAGLPDASFDFCMSHVVFQHIPDPKITLGYVAEIGRVLRDGGFAVFQVSNDHSIHRAAAHGSVSQRLERWLRAAVGRAPRGQGDPAWLGSAVDLDELHRAARRGGMTVERLAGAGTQFCIVSARREPRAAQR